MGSVLSGQSAASSAVGERLQEGRLASAFCYSLFPLRWRCLRSDKPRLSGCDPGVLPERTRERTKFCLGDRGY